jgi:phosphoadenosine phosphosulfate reductase
MRPLTHAEAEATSRQLEGAEPERVLAWTYRRFRRVALVASFQAESVLLIEMATRLVSRPRVITLDTGRLPQETHDLIEEVRRRFDLELQVVHPDAAELEEMVGRYGPNLFSVSPEQRRLCCGVRKSHPLERALRDCEAWVTGLRRDSSPTRRDTPLVALDTAHGGIAKVAPLAGWSRERVWTQVRARGLPVHALYARGYASIGCAPCTRALRPGEDERAGRWWWEQEGTVRECGLHWAGPMISPGGA